MDKKKKTLSIFTTVGPAGIWLSLLIVIPVLYVFIISFMQMADKKMVYIFTLGNYRELISSLYFSVYFNSFKVALINTLICIVAAYPMAYIMANASRRRKKLYMILLMLPFYTNLIIRLNGWKVILHQVGPLNEWLMNLGIIKEPITFMYTNGAITLGMVYSLLPFMVLPLISSITNLDKTLLEASYDLGFGKIGTFFKVTLPLTKAGIFSGSIMVFIPTMAYFFVSDIMGGAKHKLIGNIIQTQFNSAYNWPLGAAFAIVLILLTLIMVAMYKKTGGDMDSLAL